VGSGEVGSRFYRNFAGRFKSDVVAKKFSCNLLRFASCNDFGGRADILRLAVDVGVFVGLPAATVTVMYSKLSIPLAQSLTGQCLGCLATAAAGHVLSLLQVLLMCKLR